MRKLLPLMLVLALALPSATYAQKAARTIVEESIVAMKEVKTMKGRIKKTERIGEDFIKGEMYFKVIFNPYQVYLYNFSPDVGSEVLFKTGWNKGRAYIHPNKFPFVNVNLKPTGDLMMNDRHHTIFDVGFSYTCNVVEFLLDTRGDELEKYVSREKDINYDGQPCYTIAIDYHEYGTTTYTVKAGEDLVKIDHDLRVPAYKILELNPDLKDFYDVEAGDVLTVPNIYAKKVVLFVAKESMLPIVQIVHDDKGLFEKYEYGKFHVNPKFDPKEFTTDWHEYEF